MAQMCFKICLVIPSASFWTDTKFKYSLENGEGLRVGTVNRVSERSQNTTICPIFIIWHVSIAYFDKILIQIIV